FFNQNFVHHLLFNFPDKDNSLYHIQVIQFEIAVQHFLTKVCSTYEEITIHQLVNLIFCEKFDLI
ncbi:MAG: hypothetical protein JW866_08695, partial [Ignavibacteriales bacterium]|nr:hypothetical protein [Ignavibacteriales bacterium]